MLQKLLFPGGRILKTLPPAETSRVFYGTEGGTSKGVSTNDTRTHTHTHTHTHTVKTGKEVKKISCFLEKKSNGGIDCKLDWRDGRERKGRREGGEAGGRGERERERERKPCLERGSQRRGESWARLLLEALPASSLARPSRKTAAGLKP